MYRLRLRILCLCLLVCLGTAACKGKEEIYMGINVEITELSDEKDFMVVKLLDEKSLLGEKGETYVIQCDNDALYYLYIDNETSESKELQYDDFLIGDAITVDVAADKRAVRAGRIGAITRIQLITQRL